VNKFTLVAGLLARS